MADNISPVVPRFNSVGELWVHSMQQVLERGTSQVDGAERLREVRHLSGFVLQHTPNDPILRQHADRGRISQLEEKYRSTGLVPPYTISYGGLIYDHDGVNQIEDVIGKLHAKPETKSAVASLVVPGAAEQACLSLLDFMIRDDRLVMEAFYRSQNVYWSQPGNMTAMFKIMDQVAEAVEAQPGGVLLTAVSAHIYEPDLAEAERIVKAAA